MPAAVIRERRVGRGMSSSETGSGRILLSPLPPSSREARERRHRPALLVDLRLQVSHSWAENFSRRDGHLWEEEERDESIWLGLRDGEGMMASDSLLSLPPLLTVIIINQSPAQANPSFLPLLPLSAPHIRHPPSKMYHLGNQSGIK